MILTLEQFNSLLEAFGPDSYYYNTVDFNDANDPISNYNTLQELIREELMFESILLDQYRGSHDLTNDELQDSIEEEEKLQIRVNNWLKEQSDGK